MSELDLEIAAVKFALRSFARVDNEDVRKNMLRDKFDTIPCLDIYLGYSEERLQTILEQLQQLKIDENAKQRATVPQGNI